MLILPGNHDVNVVDRANPARLDLPFSPAKTLRKMRALSAIAAFGADRLRVIDRTPAQPGRTLAPALAPQRQRSRRSPTQGGLRLSNRLARFWDELFPLILPPAETNGLGVAILNSNADTNFSFTNALGMISVEQARGLAAAFDRLSGRAMDRRAAPSSDRISDAGREVLRAHRHRAHQRQLVQRMLKPFAPRVVVMHGHRHVDWIGACGGLKIVSAPSPVMGATTKADPFPYPHA